MAIRALDLSGSLRYMYFMATLGHTSHAQSRSGARIDVSSAPELGELSAGVCREISEIARAAAESSPAPYFCPPLTLAIRNQDGREIGAMIKRPREVDRLDAWGLSPLDWALVLDSQAGGDIAMRLLAAGARGGSRNPLLWAAMAGSHAIGALIEAFPERVDEPAPNGARPLSAAIVSRQPGAATALARAGARHDFHEDVALSSGSHWRQSPLAMALDLHGAYATEASDSEAAWDARDALADWEAGPEIMANMKQDYEAATRGSLESYRLVECLLERGADINAPCWHLPSPSGREPRLLPAWTRIYRSFQRSSAPSFLSDAYSARRKRDRADAARLARLALDSGWSQNSRDEDRCDGLAYAAKHGFPEAALMLAGAGWTPFAPDCWGDTAISSAMRCGHRELAAQLLAIGEKQALSLDCGIPASRARKPGKRL